MYNSSDNHEIATFLRFIWQAGEVYELRCLKTSVGIVSGYYDNPEKLADDAAKWSGDSEGVYWTLNPCKRAFLDRSANRCVRIRGRDQRTTSDEEIERRRLLLVDIDPIRKAGISANQEEIDKSCEMSNRVVAYLQAEGFSDPIQAFSGNGYHLLYAIDLPNEASTTTLVKGALESLAARFDDESVQIDTGVYNPSRICKLYGTMACKGQSIEDRPHRLAKVLVYPAKFFPVERGLLERVGKANIKPVVEEVTVQAKELSNGSSEWLDGFIADHEITIRTVTDKGLKRVYHLAECPFCQSHDGAAIMLGQKGFGFKCHHNRCKDKKWQDFRLHFEPDAYDATDGDKKITPADIAVELAKGQCELWHAPDKSAFATFQGGSFAVNSSSFKRLLARFYYEESSKGLTETSVANAIATISGIALFDGPEYQVYKRIARLDDRILIDLGDDSCECVEITKDGWQVKPSPVRFARTGNMAPLPRPEAGGSIDLLRPFVNLTDDGFRLFVGSLLDALKGKPPYFVNIASGEQGSAKSTLCRLSVRLVDPVVAAELSNPPPDSRALAIDAGNTYLLAYDNLSKLSQELSDAFCSVATGGGYKARKLYTDGELYVINVANPTWLNGIEEFVTQPDLLNRSIMLHSLTIPVDKRQDEGQFWAGFRKNQPAILGALYEAVSRGLDQLASVRLETLPRMADSARWLAACLPGLSWSYDSWHDAYVQQQLEAIDIALESSPASLALVLCKRPAKPVVDGHGLILRKGGDHVHNKATRPTQRTILAAHAAPMAQQRPGHCPVLPATGFVGS